MEYDFESVGMFSRRKGTGRNLRRKKEKDMEGIERWRTCERKKAQRALGSKEKRMRIGSGNR